MENNDQTLTRGERRRLKTVILLVVVLMPLVSLWAGELFNDLYNPTLDMQPLVRLGVSVNKPMVYGLCVVLIGFYAGMILRFLKPFFQFFTDGSRHSEARTATMKIPWFLLGVNSVFWLLGTVAFYGLNGWTAPRGVPLVWAVMLKFTEGFFGALVTIQLINNRLVRYKHLLGINQIRRGESDRFARWKNGLMVLSITLLTAVHTAFAANYFVLHDPALAGFTSFGSSMAGTGTALVLLALLLFWLNRREYLFQVGHLSRNLEMMAGASGADLSRRVVIINFDEIGELAQGYNRLAEKLQEDFGRLREIASTVEGHSRRVTEAAAQLSRRTETSAASSESILSAVEEFTGVLQGLRDNIAGQKERMLENLKAADQLSSGVQTVITHSGQVQEQAETNLQDAESGVSAVTESLGRVLQITDHMEGIVGKIKDAGEQTRSIDTILQGIEDISERTNLLSMNAAIEAARAGSSGRGFAVVAGEIRKLAETSSSSVGEIGSLIKRIRDSVSEAVNLAEQGLEESEAGRQMASDSESALGKIVDNLQDTGAMIRQISEATRQQEAPAAAVGEGARGLKEFTENIDGSIGRQTDGANQILASMDEISRNNEEQARSAEDLSSLAQDLRGKNRDLMAIIRQFELDEAQGAP